MPNIRPIVLCLFEHDNSLLLQEFWHPHHHHFYYRPLGGGIEFGEPASVALRREMREEIRSEISEPELLGVFENLFLFGSDQKHEVVFLYKARLMQEELYQKEAIEVWDSDPPTRAIWMPLENLTSDAVIFYPERLREMIYMVDDLSDL